MLPLELFAPLEQLILLLGNILGPLIHAGSSAASVIGAQAGMF